MKALLVEGKVDRVQPGALRFFFKQGSAKIFASAADIDAEFWRATFGSGHKDLEYYCLLEETMRTGFTYRYLVLFDLNERAIALQPLVIVDQDLAVTMNGRLGRAIKFIRAHAPRFLYSRILLAGCLVGDGKFGVLPDVDPSFAAELLAEALQQFAKSETISLVVIKDFPVWFRPDLGQLIRSGYTRLDGFPSLYLDLDFASVEQYMRNHLTRVTRKSFKRKLRKTRAAAPPIELEVLEDCSLIIDEIYELYLSVAKRSEVTFEVFTKEYFIEAARRMAGHVRYFIWRRGGKPVAFSFCTVWGDTIYDNDLGLDYSIAHELNLYHLTFHDILEWGLKHRLRSYQTAPFNYEMKLHLGLQPVPLDLYVRHPSPLLNSGLKLIAPRFAPAKVDPALRKYFRS